MDLDYVANALETTIVEDVVTKKVLFLAGLLTYTENDQINVACEGPSSVGKTYIVLQVLKLFPCGINGDVKIYAGISPTAFHHAGTPLENVEHTTVHDIERKIVVFIDQPNDIVAKNLRPLKSHDQKILEWSTTGPNLSVLKSIVKGYATFIDCATPLLSDEQEKTRNIYVSPSEDSIKIEKSLELLMLKANDPALVEKFIDETPKREKVRKQILTVKEAHVNGVQIVGKGPLNWFKKAYRRPQVRHMRDFPRLLSMIKGDALLQIDERTIDSQNVVVATDEDVDEGIKLFKPIAVCNELGLSPHQYEIYLKVVEPLLNEEAEVSYNDFQVAYQKYYGKPLNYYRMTRVYVPSLTAAGLVVVARSCTDKRIPVLVKPENSKVIQERFGSEEE